jgi:hypothetical protein
MRRTEKISFKIPWLIEAAAEGRFAVLLPFVLTLAVVVLPMLN